MKHAKTNKLDLDLKITYLRSLSQLNGEPLFKIAQYTDPSDFSKEFFERQIKARDDHPLAKQILSNLIKEVFDNNINLKSAANYNYFNKGEQNENV